MTLYSKCMMAAAVAAASALPVANEAPPSSLCADGSCVYVRKITVKNAFPDKAIYLKTLNGATSDELEMQAGAVKTFTYAALQQDPRLPVPDKNRNRIQASFAPRRANGKVVRDGKCNDGIVGCDEDLETWIETSGHLVSDNDDGQANNMFRVSTHGGAWNFARQKGYTDLNMEVKFLDPLGNPMCDQLPWVKDQNPGYSGYSQARMNHRVAECPADAKVRVKEYPGKDGPVQIQVCEPLCSDGSGRFLAQIDENSPTDLEMCEPCVKSNTHVKGADFKDVSYNGYAAYVSDHSISMYSQYDVRQSKTVTTAEDYFEHTACPGGTKPGCGAREWNPLDETRLPDWSPGCSACTGAVATLASTFECWDKGGAGAQGFGPVVWDNARCPALATSHTIDTIYVEFGPAQDDSSAISVQELFKKLK